MRTRAAQPSWPLTSRPLGPRTILAQLTIVVVAEGVLFALYSAQDARFHWATHLLAALTTAALVSLAWLTFKGRPARGQVLLVLGLHVVAMFPDVLFSAGVAHDDWMDVFLGHISSHDMPGGATTWLAVALLAAGVYAVVLSLWLRARRAEAMAGAAPGTGTQQAGQMPQS